MSNTKEIIHKTRTRLFFFHFRGTLNLKNASAVFYRGFSGANEEFEPLEAAADPHRPVRTQLGTLQLRPSRSVSPLTFFTPRSPFSVLVETKIIIKKKNNSRVRLLFIGVIIPAAAAEVIYPQRRLRGNQPTGAARSALEKRAELPSSYVT